MNFLHSMEQRLLAESVSAALSGATSETAPGILAELDVYRLMVPEERGGSGLGLVEAAIVLEAAGRHGIRLPLAATILLADAVALSAPGSIQANGGTPALVDIAGPGRLVAAGDGRLRGTLGARNRARLRWLAAPVDDSTLVLVAADEPRATPRHSIEPGGEAVVMDFDLPADAARLSVPDHADCMAVLHCAELLGAASHVFDLSIDYLKERNQFGQPIGANQALKHMAADAYMMLENARVAVEYAAAALDAARASAQDAELRARAYRAVRVMLGYVPGATRELAETAVQFHGGIGLTWEYQLNGYLRRIIRLGMDLGQGVLHRRALLDAAFAPERSALPAAATANGVCHDRAI